MSFKWFKPECTSFNKQLGSLKIPVSVVLVVIKSRMHFVKSFVIPSIEANNPAEIIIVDDDDLSNQEKRNKGASMATQPYLFICDDDVIMPADHLYKLWVELDTNPDYAFAYTDYQAIVMDSLTHPKGKNYYQKSQEFSLITLKENNYIDTCSLVRKEIFSGFDPVIKRFQDWDLWLTLALKGHIGKYVKHSGIIKFYLDEGITSGKFPAEEARKVILQKHGLSNWFYSMIYLNTGSGFNGTESKIIEASYAADGTFEVNVQLNDKQFLKGVRFDPVEQKLCEVELTSISFYDGMKHNVSTKGLKSNAKRANANKYKFTTKDPQFFLPIQGNIQYIKIIGKIYFYQPPHSFFKKVIKKIVRYRKL